MAFNTSPPRAEYEASAGQTVFDFAFKIYNDSDLVVYQKIGANDAILLLLNTDFTSSIDGDSGGDITLVSGASSGDTITILRDLPLNRDTEYQTSGDLLAETLNEDQDYQTYLIADQDDKIAAIEAGDVSVSSFVLRTGDTMTGQLKGITPVDASDITRKDYVDASDALRLLLAGGTVTGQIKGITPVANEDLTRKDYVDSIKNVLIVNDTKATTVSGGNSTSSTWNTRDINTTIINTLPGSSIGTNQITLSEGTYEIYISAPAYACNYNKVRLYNVTDASVEDTGTSEYASSANAGYTRSILDTTITITSTKVFGVDHYTSLSTTNGLGIATADGSKEVYTTIKIRKI